MNKSNRTRAFIIERTASLFNAKGYSGASLNDITAATGLTKGSVYGNFKGKDEVALAVFDRNASQLRDIIEKKTNKAGSTSSLLAYADVLDAILKDPVLRYGCPILNTAIESDDTHHALRNRARGALNGWRKSIKKMIVAGKATKEIRPDVDAGRIAFRLISLIEGGIMISKLTGKRADVLLVKREIKDLIREITR